jgi:hypothetical protein
MFLMMLQKCKLITISAELGAGRAQDLRDSERLFRQSNREQLRICGF